MDPLKLSPSSRGPESVLYIDDPHRKVTISPRTVSVISELKSKPAKTVRNPFELKTDLYLMRKNHTVSIDGLRESADFGGRKPGKISLEFKGKTGTKTTRGTGTEDDEKPSQVPFLGVNFEKGNPNVGKPAPLSPIRTEKREKTQIRNASGKGKPVKITFVTVGEDLKETHFTRNERFIAWANYHTEAAALKKPVSTRQGNKPEASKNNFSSPSGFETVGSNSRNVGTTLSLTVSPAPFQSENGREFSIRKEAIQSPQILHVSSQPSPGFLSERLSHLPIGRFPLKSKQQKPSKIRYRSSVHKEPFFPISSESRNFARFSRKTDTGFERNTMNPEEVKRSQIFQHLKPALRLHFKDFPSQRIPVDFNLFRNMQKSSSRHPTEFQRIPAFDL